MEEFHEKDRVVRVPWKITSVETEAKHGVITRRYHQRLNGLGQGEIFYEVTWDDGTITKHHLGIGLKREEKTTVIAPTTN